MLGHRVDLLVQHGLGGEFSDLVNKEKEVPIRTRSTLAETWLSKLGIPVDSLL